MTTEPLDAEAPAEGHDFDWLDDEDDVVLPHRPAVAVYLNPKGQVVLRQLSWPDPYDEQVVVFDPEYGRAVAAAILQRAGLEDEAAALLAGNGVGAGSRGRTSTERGRIVLGRETIPATVVDLAEIARGEFAENMVRKDFTPTEEVAIYRALAPKVATPRGRPKPENFRNKEKGETRDKLGAYVGKSGRTLEKQVAIVGAAEAEPEKYGKLNAAR